MTQSKKGSFVEACINTVVGFIISLVANPLFCWLFNVKMSNSQMVSYVLAFTVLSIIRGYVIRRFFNKMIHNTAQKLVSYERFK